MQISPKALKELQEILRRDYHLAVSNEHANAIGVRLLKITKISLKAVRECAVEGCEVAGLAGHLGALNAPIAGTRS